MNKEQLATELREMFVDGISPNRRLNGWHRDIFYDVLKKEWYETSVQSPGTTTQFEDDNMIFVVRVHELCFWDVFPEEDEDKDMPLGKMYEMYRNSLDVDWDEFVEDFLIWVDSDDRKKDLVDGPSFYDYVH